MWDREDAIKRKYDEREEREAGECVCDRDERESACGLGGARQGEACGIAAALAACTRYSVYLFYWCKSTNTDAEGACSLHTAASPSFTAVCNSSLSTQSSPLLGWSDDDAKQLQQSFSYDAKQLQQSCHRAATEQQQSCNRAATELQQSCNYDAKQCSPTAAKLCSNLNDILLTSPSAHETDGRTRYPRHLPHAPLPSSPAATTELQLAASSPRSIASAGSRGDRHSGDPESATRARSPALTPRKKAPPAASQVF